MSSSTISTGGGIGFGNALVLLFVALKLLGKISWSWWWVLSPIWMGAALLFVIMLVWFGVALARRG